MTEVSSEADLVEDIGMRPSGLSEDVEQEPKTLDEDVENFEIKPDDLNYDNETIYFKIKPVDLDEDVQLGPVDNLKEASSEDDLNYDDHAICFKIKPVDLDEDIQMGAVDSFKEESSEVINIETPPCPAALDEVVVLHQSMVKELRHFSSVQQIEQLLLGFEDTNILVPTVAESKMTKTCKSLREIFDVLLNLAKIGASSRCSQ